MANRRRVARSKAEAVVSRGGDSIRWRRKQMVFGGLTKRASVSGGWRTEGGDGVVARAAHIIMVWKGLGFRG